MRFGSVFRALRYHVFSKTFALATNDRRGAWFFQPSFLLDEIVFFCYIGIKAREAF